MIQTHIQYFHSVSRTLIQGDDLYILEEQTTYDRPFWWPLKSRIPLFYIISSDVISQVPIEAQMLNTPSMTDWQPSGGYGNVNITFLGRMESIVDEFEITKENFCKFNFKVQNIIMTLLLACRFKEGVFNNSFTTELLWKCITMISVTIQTHYNSNDRKKELGYSSCYFNGELTPSHIPNECSKVWQYYPNKPRDNLW